ncbi:hypothetical protein [Sporosarcina sp. G11-34]|uniref:hypothetical protein n=1 Tax=Sporosarcina sp. G11-34 TaxID=2849605 RepID=UPI0022A92032|nr:hypothetical protein [Sporosarcina sp. G11-34]MCZ2258150.1 hypothetical protein [Sporosarcina sp. G11-34]
MTYQVSVFIMDVSNSSTEDVGDELSTYLHQLEERISNWTKDITTTKVIHRSGDEIVVICSGYATAYTIAFYMSRVWKFKDHKPYFGLSFGDIQNDVSDLNIETWIHPLMKQARYSNDILKQQEHNRVQFNFKLDDFSNKKTLEGYHLFRSQFEVLLNTILRLQQDQINEQTDIQSLVCSLFLILNQQNKVSNYLGRSASTVSSHMKKGKSDAIMSAFTGIVNVLNSLQANSEFDLGSNPQLINDRLQNNIKLIVSNNLHDYFPINS